MDQINNFKTDLLIDGNFGKLTKHLRFYGISVYYNINKDHFLLETIANDHKIPLITSSKKHKNNTYCLILPDHVKTKLISQIDFLCENHQINELFKIMNTRCGLCNNLLTIVDSEDYMNHLPSKTLKFYQESVKNLKVWFCFQCRKSYWEGTHWNQILQKIDKWY
ncbi:MAG: hypothetical protein HeimC3_54290 [Candidatus Heimdallarchaeota archaeon LC_3]|nr:MAG: hypothetical protein HeimC3_54290 [Candidatus Heimdallarchaeota archaeon LC_3]